MNTTLKNWSSMEQWCRSIVGWNQHFVCDATNHMCDTTPLCRALNEKYVSSSNHGTQYSMLKVVLKPVHEALRQKKKIVCNTTCDRCNATLISREWLWNTFWY